MTRRGFFLLSGGALAATAQEKYPGTPYRDYSRCLPDFLRELAGRAYRLRNAELAKLSTAEAVRARQRWARKTFWKLAGGMPERTPLNAKTLGSFERPGYRVEKVVYESQPGLFIPANLYIPAAGPGPFPGVLFQMGHSANGKAYEPYQRCCQGLVKLGFVVLAFDPMGQGERIYYPGATVTRTRLGSADEEHTVPGKQMLLYGDTSSRLQVWDAVRSLDYLASLPMVDAKRLGSTGQSGGGTLTMLLACVDDRLAAAVVCAGNTENFACANFNPPGSTDDAEQDFVASGPLGFDRWDLLYPIAPKPLLVVVSDKDFFGTYSPGYIASGWEEFQKLKKTYAVLGAAERLAWGDTPLPHGLAWDSRLQVYNWFARWLKGESRRIEEEPATAPEPDRTLWVTASGSVAKTLGGETPFTLNRKRTVDKTPADVARLLGVERPAAGTKLAVLRRTPSRAVDIEAVEVASAAKVWLPAWLFLPRGPVRSVYLLLEPASRNVRWPEGELYQSLAAAGHAVCVPNLRGIDDLWPEYSRGAARYARSHNDEDDWAWASLILGKPLLGQRVTDILAVAAALRAHPATQGRPLLAAAFDKLTVPAQMAAALEPAIGGLYLAHGLASYQSVVETEDHRGAFANFVPNLLRHTDLPEVVASLSPRKVVLAGAVDGAGATMDTEAVRKLYARAGNVEVLGTPDWNVEAIERLGD